MLLVGLIVVLYALIVSYYAGIVSDIESVKVDVVLLVGKILIINAFGSDWIRLIKCRLDWFWILDLIFNIQDQVTIFAIMMARPCLLFFSCFFFAVCVGLGVRSLPEMLMKIFTTVCSWFAWSLSQFPKFWLFYKT